jgi:hypothetical protein
MIHFRLGPGCAGRVPGCALAALAAEAITSSRGPGVGRASFVEARSIDDRPGVHPDGIRPEGEPSGSAATWTSKGEPV